MRHQRGNKKLGRPTDQRLAMLKHQVGALFKYGKIKLTLTRAKEVRRMAERAITIAKEKDLNAQRKLQKLFVKREIVGEIMKTASERFKERAGGYTRIVRIGFRKGDAASLALLELI